MIVLGIDTALRRTGYGVIRAGSVNDMTVLDCGVIVNGQNLSHSQCLRRLFGGIDELVASFSPFHAAVEDAFCAKNIKTAMILSLARGAVITALANNEIPAYLYSPRRAKRAVVGTGGASKAQVAKMISAMLELDVADIPDDSTDALAIAICHAQTALRPELKDLMPEPI